jgi:hypothetical protein
MHAFTILRTKRGLLRNDRDCFTDVIEPEFGDVYTIDPDRTRHQLDDAKQRNHDRRFPRASAELHSSDYRSGIERRYLPSNNAYFFAPVDAHAEAL